jgi:hypothetical protein
MLRVGVPPRAKHERTVLCTSNWRSMLDTTRTETDWLASCSPRLWSRFCTMVWMKRDMLVSGRASAHQRPRAGPPRLLAEEEESPEWAVLAEATEAALGDTPGVMTRGGVARAMPGGR